MPKEDDTFADAKKTIYHWLILSAMHLTSLIMIAILAVYFTLLVFLSRLAERRHGHTGNAAFYRAAQSAPWTLVALGMIAGSISGVSLVSVPAWVKTTGMSYLQMCAGFIVGYIVVAVILLPVYYRLQLTSIYGYLEHRFGPATRRAGAAFFLLSKLAGASARLYVATLVLHTFIAAPLGVNFPCTAAATLLLIWLYTHRSGQAGLLYTDALQTLMLLAALGGTLWAVAERMDLDLYGVWHTVRESSMSRIFVWDAASPQAFWRQFMSGVFIVFVMTGLDQDMMQKNMTCRTLRDAQKDMCVYGMAFLPINAILLALGILLYTYCTAQGIGIPAKSDELLPMLVSSGKLGTWIVVPFALGIVAAAFSAADGALTALTTSLCIDLLRREDDVRLRRNVHTLMVIACFACLLIFRSVDSPNVINTIYVMASYTYGPLLGLFMFGLFTRVRTIDRYVPAVVIAAPLICALLDHYAPIWWGYRFGYELLVFNGLLTAVGLLFLRQDKRVLKPVQRQ